MMTLGQFTRFPAAFKQREKSVADVKLQNFQYEYDQEENKIKVTSDTTTGYRQELEIFDDKVTLRSPCKVYCNCQSFQYEFAHAIFKYDSLLHAPKLLRSIVQRPKSKNQFDIPSPCKHLVKLARETLKIKLK